MAKLEETPAEQPIKVVTNPVVQGTQPPKQTQPIAQPVQAPPTKQPLVSWLGNIKKPVRGKPKSMTIYGRVGVGKTHLAYSIMDVKGPNKVLIIDTESSSEGTYRAYPDANIIDIRDIARTNNITQLAAFETVIGDILNPPDDSLNQFNTIIIDTFGRVGEWKADAVEADNQINSFAKNKLVKSWAENVIRELHENGRFVIFVAHAEETTLKDDKRACVVQANKSISALLTTLPSIVGYIGVSEDASGQPVRSLIVRATPTLETKNRYGLLETIINPTLGKVLSQISEAGK